MTAWLEGLNEHQRQAVTAPLGNALVLAGAGSGKTRVLVSRMACLVHTHGISPHAMLAVTFTNKAAGEMKARLAGLLHGSVQGLWVGTFHGLCHRLLRRHFDAARLPEQFHIMDSDDQTRLIKRVIAVAGDTVEIRDKRLLINGEEVPDPNAHFTEKHVHDSVPRDRFGPVTVPPGKFFVMGDNRDQSYDSRYWGFADVEAIKGRATFIYWSWDGSHWPRWNRLGHVID